MPQNNNNGQKPEYLDVVAFCEKGTDNPPKKVPVRIGYAWKNQKGALSVRLQTIPVPGNGWDGSLLIEKRQEREEDTGRSSQSSQPNQRRRD